MASTKSRSSARDPRVAPDTDPVPEDGRHMRRDRNRTAVLEALQSLVLEGDPKPRPERIAERAGVSLRSLYRYFPDFPSLMQAALDLNFERATATVPPLEVGVGALDERIERLVEARLALYEALAPVVRMARAVALHNDVVRARFDLGREILRLQLEEQFADELKQLRPTERAAVAAAADGLCQLETLLYLRGERGLTDAEVTRAMRTGLRALLAP